MKKIAFYCSSLSWGGLELNFCRYAIILLFKGYYVKIYCVKNSPIANFLLKNNNDVVFVERNRKYFDFINAYRVYRKLKKENIDILWLRAPRDVIIAGIIKTFTFFKIKIIYQQAMQISTRKKDIFHTIRFAKINAWLTPLNYLAAQIKELTYFNPVKIHIIPLAVKNPADKFLTSSKARNLLNIPTDKFVIGIIGRIDVLKNQLFLIKALKLIREENPDSILLIVGDVTKEQNNDYLKLLHQTCVDLNLTDFVHFRPYIENIDVFYKAIDLFALSSINETFGMVTIEAMSFAVPIIAPATAANNEILKEGELGFIYEPGNIKIFCQNVNNIIQQYDNARNLAAKAYDEVNIKYSENIVYTKIEKIIDSL